MAYDTNTVLENSFDGYVAEGKSIKGGYFVIDALANIPSVLNVKGAKCYNQADNKVYVYNGSSWVEDAKGMSNPMTTAGDIIVGGASGAPTRLAKGTAGQVLTMNSQGTGQEWKTPTSTGNLYRHELTFPGVTDKKIIILSKKPDAYTQLDLNTYSQVGIFNQSKILAIYVYTPNQYTPKIYPLVHYEFAGVKYIIAYFSTRDYVAEYTFENPAFTDDVTVIE